MKAEWTNKDTLEISNITTGEVNMGDKTLSTTTTWYNAPGGVIPLTVVDGIDYDRHTHCIICSKYKSLGNETDQHDYICEECMSSFPTDYILFRLKCHKEGIWLKQFDNLEMRLSGIELEEKDLYEKEHTFNWDEEDEV